MFAAVWRTWSPHSWRINRNSRGPVYRFARRLFGPQFRSIRKAAADRFGDSILARFESLGDNCEFGMVQREYGVEPIGLFRFAGASLNGLIALLESRMSFASNPCELASNIKLIQTSEDEYITSVEQYEFTSHTFIAQNSRDFDRIKKRESERLLLLSRKLLDDLEDADKIFVYKSNPTADRADIDALSEALRTFGPNCLLWVTTEEEGRPPGFVEELSEGLMRGYIDKFALYDGSLEISRAVWGTLCENAHAVWIQRREPQAARLI